MFVGEFHGAIDGPQAAVDYFQCLAPDTANLKAGNRLACHRATHGIDAEYRGGRILWI
jgi:hypothetical protein